MWICILRNPSSRNVILKYMIGEKKKQDKANLQQLGIEEPTVEKYKNIFEREEEEELLRNAKQEPEVPEIIEEILQA